MMALCCSSRRRWNLDLQTTSEEGKLEECSYLVEIISERNDCCCHNGIHSLRLNGKIYEQRIYDNICFPLCCAGGEYEWQERGHFFRIELPSLFIHDGLYVDGTEIKTKRLNTTEWKYQFALWLILGFTLILLGVIFIAIERSDCCWKGFLYLGISCTVTGLLTLIPGVLGWCKAIAWGRQYKRLVAQRRKEREIEEQTTF